MSTQVMTFFIGMTSFSAMKKHTISMLISMEIILISVIFMLLSSDTSYNKVATLFVFMSFMVAESATAMSMITKLSKKTGGQLAMT